MYIQKLNENKEKPTNNKQTPLVISQPYKYDYEGEITIFDDEKKGMELDYTNSDCLILFDANKWENSIKQATDKAPEYSCAWYESALSTYLDKAVVIYHISVAINSHTGYPYQLFGYKEATQQSDINTFTTDKTSNNLNSAYKSQVIEGYGLARFYKDYLPGFGRLIPLPLVIVPINQLPQSTSKLFLTFLASLMFYLSIENFWLIIIIKRVYWNDKALALNIAIALISSIAITYLVLNSYDNLIAVIFFILMVATQLTNDILPIYRLRKRFSHIIKLRKLATSS